MSSSHDCGENTDVTDNRFRSVWECGNKERAGDAGVSKGVGDVEGVDKAECV